MARLAVPDCCDRGPGPLHCRISVTCGIPIRRIRRDHVADPAQGSATAYPKARSTKRYPVKTCRCRFVPRRVSKDSGRPHFPVSSFSYLIRADGSPNVNTTLRRSYVFSNNAARQFGHRAVSVSMNSRGPCVQKQFLISLIAEAEVYYRSNPTSKKRNTGFGRYEQMIRQQNHQGRESQNSYRSSL